MQKELLEQYPDADVKVYAVWFNMTRSDSRAGWNAKLLDDPRVTRYWDENQDVGWWYGTEVTRPGEEWVEWDAWFLYGSETTWEEGAPPEHVKWGRTIISTAEQLKESFKSVTAAS